MSSATASEIPSSCTIAPGVILSRGTQLSATPLDRRALEIVRLERTVLWPRTFRTDGTASTEEVHILTKTRDGKGYVIRVVTRAEYEDAPGIAAQLFGTLSAFRLENSSKGEMYTENLGTSGSIELHQSEGVVEARRGRSPAGNDDVGFEQMMAMLLA